MGKIKKSLQKFTIKPHTVEWLFNLPKVKYSDVKTLTEADQKVAYKIMNDKINALKGEERDKFVEQFKEAWDISTHNQLWESNHIQITGAISRLIQDYKRMPSNSEISQHTGLSRQTVHKHLKEYVTNPLYLEQMEQFKFMTSRVLATVYSYAIAGDMRAAKLYFRVAVNPSTDDRRELLIQSQNNFIQINGMVISQEVIKGLNEKQLLEIEKLIRQSVPQK